MGCFNSKINKQKIDDLEELVVKMSEEITNLKSFNSKLTYEKCLLKELEQMLNQKIAILKHKLDSR